MVVGKHVGKMQWKYSTENLRVTKGDLAFDGIEPNLGCLRRIQKKAALCF